MVEGTKDATTFFCVILLVYT